MLSLLQGAAQEKSLSPLTPEQMHDLRGYPTSDGEIYAALYCFRAFPRTAPLHSLRKHLPFRTCRLVRKDPPGVGATTIQFLRSPPLPQALHYQMMGRVLRLQRTQSCLIARKDPPPASAPTACLRLTACLATPRCQKMNRVPLIRRQSPSCHYHLPPES